MAGMTQRARAGDHREFGCVAALSQIDSILCLQQSNQSDIQYSSRIEVLYLPRPTSISNLKLTTRLLLNLLNTAIRIIVP